MSVGSNIRYLRNKEEMTQKELAEKLDVSFQTISKWENNEVEPDISSLGRVSKLFNVSVDDLINLTLSKEERNNIESTNIKKEITYNGETLRCEKLSTKTMLIIGIIICAIGFILFVSFVGRLSVPKESAVVKNGKFVGYETIDVFSIGNAIVSFLGLAMTGVGGALIFISRLMKKDFIEITSNGVNGFANMKKFNYPWKNIKEAKATASSIKLQTKDNDKPIPIFMVKNPEEFCNKINKILED